MKKGRGRPLKHPSVSFNVPVITSNTPGVYHISQSSKKGCYKRIDRQEVEALRNQGLTWKEIAGRLNVTLEAIKYQKRKWKGETKGVRQ